MVSLIEAAVLSIIQGITEWFPISSSGHLALMQNLFGFQNLPYDVFLHFASIIAVIYIFRKDIIELLNFKRGENVRYIVLIIIAMIPIFLIGMIFRDFIASVFSNMLFLGFFFFLSGIVVYSTKFSRERKKKLNWLDSLVIGIFQAIAILPGISRSGFTISGGLFRGLKKETAIKFSFLLAIPVMLGASLAEAANFITEVDYSILIVSFIITFFISFFTIKILLNIIRKGKFYLFGIYNVILGLIVLICSLLM